MNEKLGGCMKFADKVKDLRKKAGWTQKDLADQLGVTVRTVGSYETGQSYPKSRQIYDKMAKIFAVDRNYLLMEEVEEGRGGGMDPDPGMAEAQDLVRRASAMFAGGSLTEEDKDAVMRALQDAYWEGRKEG